MTTPDNKSSENEGYNKGNREALRQLMSGTAREALRRFTMHPTSVGYEGAIDGAVQWQVSIIDAGGGVNLMPFVRENCAHQVIRTNSVICKDCGEIEPVR